MPRRGDDAFSANFETSLMGVGSLSVSIGERSVGTLAQTEGGPVAFEYDDDWLADGFAISPFSLPLEKRLFVAPPRPLEGLFGVFDDSLPDGWGRLLVDRMLKKRGVDPYRVPPLARLAIVGNSGMGALNYEPELTLVSPAAERSLDELAQECSEMLESNMVDDLDTLYALGGSSGGARPKVFIKIDDSDWIVKFPSSRDPRNIGVQEFAIAQAAVACGLEMPEVRLMPSEQCEGYFAIKRFDRVACGDGEPKRIHMVSAGGLLETSHRIPNLDYDLLMRLCLRLTGSMDEVRRLYRLMVFNVVVGNRDDHAKNFTFLCEEGNWRLSPAYDLTCNGGINGEHTTTVNGKGKNIELDDMVSVGVRAGLNGAEACRIAEEVRDCAYELVGLPLCLKDILSENTHPRAPTYGARM